MKYVLILLLSISSILFALPNDNMTDVETTDNYRKDIQSIQTVDYECNLYVEKAGLNLYTMSIAEQNNDKKTVSSEFLIFLKNSNKAIEYCQYSDINVSNDLINIQEGVVFYYNNEFK